MSTTIKSILERVDHSKTEDNPDGNPFLAGGMSVAEALAGIRQILKECEPLKCIVVEDSEIYDEYDNDRELLRHELQENNISFGKNQATAEYTANIDKRLG